MIYRMNLFRLRFHKTLGYVQYVQRNGSGVFVYIIQHGSETYLRKRHGLEVDVTFFGVIAVSKFCFAEH